MNRAELFAQIQAKQSYLCIGLDPDMGKIPRHLLQADDPVFEFNRQIIDATADLAVAYKPNLAFYEALGHKGWEGLQKTEAYIPSGIFSIADAKRGDIGNTSALYAKAFFEQMDFDAVTVAPYMGEDSITPFFKKGKWVIVLAHTSNPGSADFQQLQSKTGRKFYEEVILKTNQWGTPDNLMYVIGATHADALESVRLLAPDHFFLVPGVGAQGGNLESVSRHGLNKQGGLLVNSSRAIIYASDGKDFASQARKAAQGLQEEMKRHLDRYL